METVTVEDSWAVEDVSRNDGKPAGVPTPVAAPPGRHQPAGKILSIVAGLVGVAALAATAWVYAETQREIVRVSTDIAQIRLSLELYGRQQAVGRAPAPDDSLIDLANRVAILEQGWRGAAPASIAVPALPATSTTTAASDGDCLPPGMRFMVAAGDSYPVCGTGAVVDIGAVDDGFISLADGTVIAQGGNIALPNSACMIGVLPSDGGGISGFAEIRVTC